VDDRAETISRSEALLKGALAVGTIYGLGSIGPYVRRALGAAGGRDVEVLNFFLPFEYLQAKIYKRALEGINDKGQHFKMSPDRRKLVATLLEEERRHIQALSKTIEKLGGKPVPEAKSYAFAYRGASVFLGISEELEVAAISAYNGAIPSLESKEAQELAASIAQVEGRHVAALLIQRHEKPAPGAFDTGLTEYKATLSVEKFTGVY
jgi:rubrerythrin